MLETHLTKATAESESSNAGVWELRAPDAAAILQLFSNNTHF